MSGRAGVRRRVEAWRVLTREEKREAGRDPDQQMVLLRLECGHHVIRYGYAGGVARCGHCRDAVTVA